MIEKAGPIYKHDCSSCIYLGTYQLEEDFRYFKKDNKWHDLYYCGSNDPTVICRNSDDGPDYHSGLTFAYAGLNPFLIKAYNLANYKNLTKPQIITFRSIFLESYLESFMQKTKESGDIIEPLYNFLFRQLNYDLWDNIKTCYNRPACNQRTAEYLIGLLKKLSKQPQRVLTSWVNFGLEVKNELNDNQVCLPYFDLKENFK